MGFLLREEKENALIEYNILREEIWERDYKTWVVNAILIVGSLLAAFAPVVGNFPTPILSVVLVAVASVLHATSARASSIDYARLEELARQLNLTGPTRTYESKISGQWWYVARRNVAYVLFAVLISIYLYFIFNNIYVLAIAIAAGFLLIIAKGEKGRRGDPLEQH